MRAKDNDLGEFILIATSPCVWPDGDARTRIGVSGR